MAMDIEITEDLILGLRTPAGAWDRRTLAALGVAWPPAKGWKHRIIGMRVPEATLTALRTPPRKSVAEKPPPVAWE